jgi:Kelch motif
MTAIRRALPLASLLLSLIATGCGASSATSSTAKGAGAAKHGHPTAHRAPVATARLSYRHLYALPAPLRDPASAVLPGAKFVFVGGLTAADTSAGEIETADLHRVLASGTLSSPQHDAQGTALGGRAYVFGGGDLTQYDHILGVDSAGQTVRTVGRLPALASDVAVTEVGGTAYVVGGFNGAAALNTIVAWRPGAPAQVVGHLPVALRYAAVASAGGQVLIIGGSTPAGASRAVYRFDPVTGHTREIARLPHPITHAGAATLGPDVYLVGGRGDLSTTQTAAIWAINPTTGTIRTAGHLPQALSDTGVLTVGDAIVVAGGLARSGATASGVGELLPAQP